MDRKLSILVVDDDPFVRGTLVRQLASLGVARADGAADGREAGARMADTDTRYDVIVTDLQMPGEDGIQLLRRLSQGAADPAVILISSLDPKLLHTAEEIAHQRGVRVLGSLTKPVSTSALAALLARINDERQPVAASAKAGLIPSAADLATALEHEQIHVAVQPQLRLADDRVCGVEALARWTLADGRAVPAPLFVALAEQHGLIAPLTEHVASVAFGLAARWHARGLDLHVSVNLAPAVLDDIGLPDRLQRMAQSAGVPANRLVLEVTETGISTGTANMLEVLGRLRLAGFGISIDDFGTGYSSLQRVSWVPFTELKIDRSFVVGAAHAAHARSIVHSSLALARDLHLTSVAEGVESVEQQEMLRNMGCDVIQGYYVSRPMDPGSLPGWLATRSALPAAPVR